MTANTLKPPLGILGKSASGDDDEEDGPIGLIFDMSPKATAIAKLEIPGVPVTVLAQTIMGIVDECLRKDTGYSSFVVTGPVAEVLCPGYELIATIDEYNERMRRIQVVRSDEFTRSPRTIMPPGDEMVMAAREYCNILCN